MLPFLQTREPRPREVKWLPRPHGSRRKARPRSQTVGRMQNKTRGPGRRFSPHLIFFSLADGGAKSDVASQTVLQRMPDVNSCLPKGVPWSDAFEKLNKKIPLPRACSQPSMRHAGRTSRDGQHALQLRCLVGSLFPGTPSEKGNPVDSALRF